MLDFYTYLLCLDGYASYWTGALSKDQGAEYLPVTNNGRA